MLKKSKYEAIIFDLDGTLINSLPYHELAFKDLLLEHNIRVNENYLRKLIGLSTGLILKNLKKKYKFQESLEDLREERRYHYFKFLGTRDIVFSGVKKLLKDLRLNYKLAIATGSSRVTFNHSADKDFEEMFETVITINDVKKERGKPFPDQLLLAAKKIQVNPKNCLMIGDSIYDGIAAKRAGMDFLGVLSGYNSKTELTKVGAKKVLKKVLDLRKYLNQKNL